MESLPDPLLGKIFAAAGQQAGASISLVSRSWHHVFYSEPALWRYLELAAESLHRANEAGQVQQWCAAKAGLLRRVGTLVHHMSYTQQLWTERGDVYLDDKIPAAARGHDWQLSSSVLAHLSPAILQSLRLEAVECDPAAAEVLQRLTQLTSLYYDCSNALPAVSILLPLTRLRQLEWLERRQAAGVQQVDVQQLLARLPQLHSWCLGMSFGRRVRATMQIGGAVLGNCAVEGCNRVDGTVQHLTLLSIEHLPSMWQLVAATLPAGTLPGHLRSLSIYGCPLSLPVVLDSPSLGHLTRLWLDYCSFPDGAAAPVIEALLQRAPRLQSLTLSDCLRRQPLPPALVSRTGLQHLGLMRNGMTELPPGPYLSSLVALDLGRNRFSRLPAALSAATNLKELSLVNNHDLLLSTEDLNGILLPLPQLQCLYLDGRAPPQMLSLLAHAAPRLRIADEFAFKEWQPPE